MRPASFGNLIHIYLSELTSRLALSCSQAGFLYANGFSHVSNDYQLKGCFQHETAQGFRHIATDCMAHGTANPRRVEGWF